MGAEEVTAMLKGLQQLSCEERLRGQGAFSMEKGRLHGHLSAALHG